MEPCLEIRFVKILNKTAFYRKDENSDTNIEGKNFFEKVKSINKEINSTGCVKKPRIGYVTRTTKTNYSAYKHNPEVNNTADDISEEDLNNVISDCPDSNSDARRNDVSELCCIKEFTGFCDWLANCVTEENCLVPEDLTVYNELMEAGKVLELDETWRMYYEQPVDVLKLLEGEDFVNGDTEIQVLDQRLEDMDYIRNQLRCELQNVGQAVEDMKRKQNNTELQLSEHVKQCLIHCKQSNISLEQLISEINTVKETLHLLATDVHSNSADNDREPSSSIASTSSKLDLEESQNCKQEKVSHQEYVFQTSLRKYEAACLLFVNSVEAVFSNFVDEVDEVLYGAQCEDSENYKFHVNEDSDLHEFCRLQLSLPNTMVEHMQLACKEKALTGVIEELQSLKEDMKTGNFGLSCLQIRVELVEAQELLNLKNENETFDDELYKTCTMWVKHHIKYALLDSTYSKLLTAGINDVTMEKLLDVMLRVKATGDILTVISMIDCNFINATVKLIEDTEDSLAKYVDAHHAYKAVLEYNCADCHVPKNIELLKRLADMLDSNVSEIENTLKTIYSSISDQLKSVLLVFSRQYNNLRDIEYQLNKWWISVCNHCMWKSLQFDVVDWIDLCENQILEFQCRLETLSKCFYENQEKITQNEEKRMKRLKWISFLVEGEQKRM